MPSFPPLLSIASTLSELKWAITSPKKGQAMQGCHEEQSALSKCARLSPLEWNAGTARVAECVLTTPACQGLRAGPSLRTKDGAMVWFWLVVAWSVHTLPRPSNMISSMGFQGLSGPISRDTAILSLQYPISRDTFLNGGLHSPKMVPYPPLVPNFTQAYLRDTPFFCNVSRSICVIPHKNKHERVLWYERYKFFHAIWNWKVSLVGL